GGTLFSPIAIMGCAAAIIPLAMAISFKKTQVRIRRNLAKYSWLEDVSRLVKYRRHVRLSGTKCRWYRGDDDVALSVRLYQFGSPMHGEMSAKVLNFSVRIGSDDDKAIMEGNIDFEGQGRVIIHKIDSSIGSTAMDAGRLVADA